MSYEEQPAGNPLVKYYRQPKLYIQLPSDGRFYPEGSLEKTENSEYPVYSMTARDDLTLKIPDALLNGQATVDIIKSCIPNIKDPWSMPSIDVDAILVAIRMATQGENLELDVNIPNTKEQRSFSLNLQTLLGQLTHAGYEEKMNYQGMIVHTKPLSYREFTKVSLRTFEEQRVISIVNNDSMEQEEKLQRFANAFRKLTDITIDTVRQAIWKIEVDGITVVNPDHISEFVQNCDKGFYNKVTDHIQAQKERFSLKPMEVESTPEEIVLGAPKKFNVPIVLDMSIFFVSGS
jgi:glycerophosphoryl diester phosphodiesterase